MGEQQDALRDGASLPSGAQEPRDDPVAPDAGDRPAELRTAFSRFVGAGALGVVGLLQTSLGSGYLWDWNLQSGLSTGILLALVAATMVALMRATWHRNAGARTVLAIACRVIGRIGVVLCVLVLFLTPVLAVELDLIEDIGLLLMLIAAAFGSHLLISGSHLLRRPHVEEWFKETSD